MAEYQVNLRVVSLKEAVGLMKGNLTVFYTYGCGSPIHPLDATSLPTTILNEKTTYLTPSSFVEIAE